MTDTFFARELWQRLERLHGVPTAWGRAIELAYQRVIPRVSPVPVKQPIFILGMERSGTTLVYSLLANHPDLYWLSTLDTVFPRSPAAVSVVRRAIERMQPDAEYVSLPGAISASMGGRFAPSECVRFWAGYMPEVGVIRDDGVLTAGDIPGHMSARLTFDLGIRLALMGRERLLAKRPGFALKIPYLHALFPDALFVDVVRAPEDNIRSLAAAKRRARGTFWGTEVPGWREMARRPYREQAQRQLATLRAIVEHDARHLPSGQYVQVSYDQLVDAPAQTTRALLACLRLSEHPRVMKVSATVVRPY